MGGGRLEFAAQLGLFCEVLGQHCEGVAFLVAHILEHVMVALGKFAPTTYEKYGIKLERKTNVDHLQGIGWIGSDHNMPNDCCSPLSSFRVRKENLRATYVPSHYR